MKRLPLLLGLLASMSALAAATEVEWSQLPPLPDAEGFAGMFAGISHGALLVAGGANTPVNRWAKDFVKVWYDDVYLLERPDGTWRKVGKLPKPAGYGVSITVPEGLLCIGGGEVKSNFADTLLLSWDGARLQMKPLAPLPKPCAMMCGALVGQTIYVAGGMERPDATVALKTFWALDLSQPDSKWRELEPCPGPERMLAVAGALDGAFYVFSGARLSAGPDGKAVREFLRDAWRYTPGHGWEKLADLPRSATAAATPVPVGSGELFVVSGDDGVNVHFEPIQEHPGFPRDTLVYQPAANTWGTRTGLPFSRATLPVAQWGDRYVLPNGEVRPRVRTPEVWSLKIPRP